MRKILAFIGLLLVMTTSGFAQEQRRQTIPEAIAQGVVGRVGQAPSGQLPSITEVLAKADLVVRGIVGPPRSYLSEDQVDIYTDYPILNPIILYQSQIDVSLRPGMPSAPVMTRIGGDAMVGGVRFAHTNSALPPLEEGREGLFILRRVDGKFRFTWDFLGAFRISEGRLENLGSRKDFAPELLDRPVEQALSNVTSRLRALGR